MKTKKVLALVVLAAFLISIVPFAAFGAGISSYATTIDAPTESAPAAALVNGNIDPTDDGAEFKVVLASADGNPSITGKLYVASSRMTTDKFFYETSSDVWTPLAASAESGLVGTVYELDLAPMAINTVSKTITIKAMSTVSGPANVVFGSDAKSVDELNRGVSFLNGSLDKIIQRPLQKYAIEFDAPAAKVVKLTSNYVVNSEKPANGIDTYKLTAKVEDAAGLPVSGTDVTFSITKGIGGSLTATRATTSVAGEAEVKIYSTRAGEIDVQARVSGVAPSTATPPIDKTTVKFRSTGVVSIKPESDNNQKFARNGTGTIKLEFSLYDASGNRIAFTGNEVLHKSVVTKPSGSSLSDSGANAFQITSAGSNGNGQIEINRSTLKKDGEYEVKVYLDNGASVSYKFSAKDQGEIVKMELSYGASSYAANTVMPQPTIKYYDAEGYSLSYKYGTETGSEVKLSISDASFIDSNFVFNDGNGILGSIDTLGRFRLKDDKSGVINMTAIDTSRNLVATKEITVQKAASYLKLTPQSVGAVGGEVTVNIELVDVDGKLASSAYKALASATSATIIAKPEGAIASADSVDTGDFEKGKASVKVSSNMEGDITLQVIITEDVGSNIAGKVYTGACTVSFGKASTGSGQVIFIVGAPSYVSGNQVFAAESPSFIENGRTFLGVRDMGTSIGATIEWDQASQTATLSKDGVTIKVTVGANKIAVTKNGVTSEIEIDAPAQNKNGRVYLPFRAVMEAFNYTVTFDQATNSIVCAL